MVEKACNFLNQLPIRA